MAEKSLTTQLEKRIDRFLENYSVKRIALAALIAGLCAVLVAFLVYMLTLSELIAVGAFLLVGLICLNVVMLVVVPPTAQLSDSRRLLIDAVNQPSLIQRVDKKGVQLETKTGKVRSLNRYEQRAWDSIITPFFFSATASRGKVIRQALEAEKQGNTLSNIQAMREELKKEETRFAEARKQMEAERAEIDRRNQELMDAEDMVIDRLSTVEYHEAQIEQMRENLNASRLSNDANSDPEEIKRKAAELKAKEDEVEALRGQLEGDREIIEQQKTELNQMKGDMLRELELNTGTEFGSDEVDSLLALQKKLDARAKEIEASARELEDRARYVSEAEDTLVERLGQLTEREASLEQGEINAGIREDT